MPYADFTLESAETTLGLITQVVDLFPTLEPAAVPAYLIESLATGREGVSLGNEKARSEVFVMPILAASTRGMSGVAIFSGQRLDADTRPTSWRV